MTDTVRSSRSSGLTLSVRMSVLVVLLALVACGQSTVGADPSATTDAPEERPDVTGFLHAVFHFDSSYFDEAHALVSPGSVAAQALLHARRARLAYDAADQAHILEDFAFEVIPGDDGYTVCWGDPVLDDCQEIGAFEFDDENRLVSYEIEGSTAWSERMVTFAEGAAWIESDEAMVELTSVSISGAGYLRMTLRFISLDDDLRPDDTRPLSHRASGFGDPVEVPDCDRSDADEASCAPVQVILGEVGDSSDARPEYVMFVSAAPSEAAEFELEDHIGFPLVGENSRGSVWIDLRSGRGEFHVEAIPGDDD